jgi:hypothetical protein
MHGQQNFKFALEVIIKDVTVVGGINRTDSSPWLVQVLRGLIGQEYFFVYFAEMLSMLICKDELLYAVHCWISGWGIVTNHDIDHILLEHEVVSIFPGHVVLSYSCIDKFKVIC